MTKSMPTVSPPQGYAVGMKFKVLRPATINRATGRSLPERLQSSDAFVAKRFVRNTYFTSCPKGCVMVEDDRGAFWPLDRMVK